jgi:hypothetical protein
MAGRLSATGKRNRSRQVSGSNRAAADVLSAIHRGLPDFDSGTRSLRSVHSTCSHFAWVISLRRAGEHQQEDGVGGGAVSIDGDCVDKALRLFPR